MAIPSSVAQLIVTLIFVVPGFVFQVVRIRLVGRTPADLDLATRILRAIVVSTVFGLVYATFLGSRLTDLVDGHGQVQHPRTDSILALIGAFVLPAIVAWLVSQTSVFTPANKFAERFRPERLTRYDPRPSAWDVAFQGATAGFVRVRMEDGTWLQAGTATNPGRRHFLTSVAFSSRPSTPWDQTVSSAPRSKTRRAQSSTVLALSSSNY